MCQRKKNTHYRSANDSKNIPSLRISYNKDHPKWETHGGGGGGEGGVVDLDGKAELEVTEESLMKAG